MSDQDEGTTSLQAWASEEGHYAELGSRWPAGITSVSPGTQ